MSALVDPLRAWLLTLSRPGKRVVLVSSDFSLLLIAVWLAFSIRWGRPYVPENMTLLAVLVAAPLIGLAVFHAFGLYRLVTRFLGVRGALRIQTGVALSVLVWSLLVFMAIGHGERGIVVPRSVIFIYALLAGLMVWVSREVAALVLKGGTVTATGGTERRRVAIYGAGAAGVQLLEALRRSGGYDPVGFVDDQPSLIGQHIGGLKVFRMDKLPRLVERDGIKEVLLAVPERQRRERQQIIREIASHAVRVRTMPAMEDIASGRVSVTDLKPIEVEELLGRDPVPADQELLARAIRGKSVMVTGAGGSIGFELTRQILRQGPGKLILFELSESALYEVETEVRDVIGEGAADGVTRPVIVGVLGSVLDAGLLERTIKLHQVQTVYHAAAYKHVPIVEANVVAGLRNNTFGTLTLAEVAERCGVERVTLISTDKAVRPTNVMGASKRLAEQIFQAAAAETAGTTVFTMVRFGNVLDSSGSVVRRFRKQIEEGGPVTVTDPKVIRYFMSIPEAATLVIQASAMARGGEVFVLDMGEPVKIDELARTMIRLMGLEVLDEDNPDGDIAIRYIGLRPGEKLFEELLIDERTTATEHPRIRRNNEPFRSRAVLDHDLKTLEAAMDAGRLDTIQAVLSRAVENYVPDTRASGAEPAAVWIPASRTVH